MDDFPVDVDDDLSELLSSPLDSDFDALCTLDPPSPTLTPSQLTFGCSSGDIPVLLYDDDYVDDLSELADGNGPAARNKRDSSATLRSRTLAAVDVKSHNGEFSAIALEILGSSESSTSVDSAGTFGPRRRTLRSSQINRHSAVSLSAKEVENLNLHCPLTISGDTTEHSTVKSRDSPRSSRQPRHALSGTFYHPVVFVDAKPRKSTADMERPEVLVDEIFAVEQSIPGELPSESDDDDDEGNKIMTPTKTAAKLSSRSSLGWGYGQYRDFLTQQNTSPLPSPAQIAQLEDNEGSALFDVSPPRRNAIRRAAVNAENSSPTRSYPEKEASPRHRRTRSTKHSSHAHEERPIVPRHGLEDDWLHDIYVQFLIDQEGFRAAHPFFAFTGIIKRRSSHSHSVNVMAQFKPATRQAFHFHYAPFETPPILRRVAVNGDDMYDYVSKQALLTLKVNGVYVLHGYEISVSGSQNHSEPSEPTKLHWQFEYLVDDRVADTSGRVMEGEKILTPLTFSCSPALLLPQQARKNSIMHVFKKGVAPKLIAEKLQPPGFLPSAATIAAKGHHHHHHHSSKNPPTPTSGLPSPPLSPPVIQSESERPPGFFASKSHGWGLHKRGLSHGARHPDRVDRSPGFSPPRSPLPAGNAHGNTVLDIAKPLHPFDANVHPTGGARRPLRRNSSAGEHKHQASHHAHIHHHRREASQKLSGAQAEKNLVSTSRHIVPPARLSELLVDGLAAKENIAPSGIMPPFVVPPVPDRNSSGFVPLAPRPRHSPTKSRDIGRV